MLGFHIHFANRFHGFASCFVHDKTINSKKRREIEGEVQGPRTDPAILSVEV